ncbi:MAG: carbon-nitrogen hydrolase family protein [Thermoplasmatales archaeon]|nr:carbon-nitrogen hydrolase family protein [Thermoplasmatales archaeon]
MKVSLAQASPKSGDKKENIRIMEKYVKKSSSDLVVFGELFLTGYGCKDFSDLAETIPGKSINKIAGIAKENRCYIVFGMPEKEKDRIYNTAVLIHPDGKINKYRKWFLPNFGIFEEKKHFKEGKKINGFNTRFGKIGLLICYDIFFPELCKSYALQGADILICISASPSLTRIYFERVMQARAVENTCFFLYTNLVGSELNFWGGNTVIGPKGDIKTKGEYFKEMTVEYDVDLNELKNARENRPVIRDSRPEIYKKLYEIMNAKK